MLEARSAYHGILSAPSAHGLAVSERDALGIASLSVRRGQLAALEERVAARFGIALPSQPRRVTAQAVSALGTGPGSWLLMHEGAAHAFAPMLASVVGESASVADQSDGYAVLRLTGRTLRDTLAKLVPIDVHAQAFDVGAVAGTVAAHLNVLLWRLDDGADGLPVFEIAVYRSLAADLWAALSHHSL